MDGEKPKRGLAALSPERRREIASLGGKAVPADKRAFAKSTTLAQSAGKCGGKNVPAAKRMFARDPGLAVRAGSKGGKVRCKGAIDATSR